MPPAPPRRLHRDASTAADSHYHSLRWAETKGSKSLLFAAGLRPTPAQATAVQEWTLPEPKRWRILADVLYDLGTGLEVLSPLCPLAILQR
nr:protein root UVB sensitive 2, chloroplastic-like isoform X2 [Ipomoea batatas]